MQKDIIFIFGPLFSQYIYRLLNTTGLVHISTDYPENWSILGFMLFASPFFYGRKSFEEHSGDLPLSTARLISSG